MFQLHFPFYMYMYIRYKYRGPYYDNLLENAVLAIHCHRRPFFLECSIWRAVSSPSKSVICNLPCVRQWPHITHYIYSRRKHL